MKIRFKKYLVIFIIIITSLSLLAGCTKNKDEGIKVENKKVNIIPEVGGEVTLPLTNFNTLNPLMTDNSYYYQFSKLIYDSLFELDNTLTPVPNLVSDYSFNNEKNEINIRLKNDVYWHDGNILTTEDVAFTIDVIKSLGKEGTYGKIFLDSMKTADLANILNYELIDNRSMIVKFDKAYNNMLEHLIFPIISKNSLNTIDEAKKMLDYNAIGTGAFKIKKYDKHRLIELERNENYWDGNVYIETIYGKVFDNEDVIKTAFDTGHLSVTPTFGVDWDKYKQNQRAKVLEYTSSEYEFLAFNFKNKLIQSPNGRAIRKAINYGINRPELIRKVYLGHGIQVDVPVNPSSYLLSDSSNTYGYNKERSIEILNSIGYVNKNEQGIFLDEANNPLRFRLLTNASNDLKKRSAEFIKESLKDIGIDIVLDFDTEIYNINDELIKRDWDNTLSKVYNGNFDIALLSWNISPITDLSYFFKTDSIYIGSNFINYSNEELDKLFEVSRFENSMADRIKNQEKIDEVLVEELPYISLFFKNHGVIYDRSIKGELEPLFFNIYNGLEKAYIINKRV